MLILNHHDNPLPQEISLWLFLSNLPTISLETTGVCCPHALLFPESNIVRIIHSVSLESGFFYWHNTFWIHTCWSLVSSFLLLGSTCDTVYPFTNERIFVFAPPQFLAIMNKATLSMFSLHLNI